MKFISVVTMHRAGSGFLSYLLNSNRYVMALPDTTSSDFHKLNEKAFFDESSQDCEIQKFIARYNIIFNPREELKRAQKLGWVNLGGEKNESFLADQNLFAQEIKSQLAKQYKSFEGLLVAIHKAYFKALGIPTKDRNTILLGTHVLNNAFHVYDTKLSDHKVIYCVRDPLVSFFSRIEMEKRVNTDGINYDFYHSLLTYSMQCQLVRILRSDKIHSIKLEDLHTNFPMNLQLLCRQIGLEFDERMRTPSVNGKAWNGEYWKGSLKSGQADLQALRKRSLSSLESNKEYADSIFNYLAIDAQFFYSENYPKTTLPNKMLYFLRSLFPNKMEIRLLKEDLFHSDNIDKNLRRNFLNLLKFLSIRILILQGLLALLINLVTNFGYELVRFGDLVNILRGFKR